MLASRGITRGLRASRPTVTLAVLVVLSLISMASGTRASLLGNFLSASVSVASHPFLITMNAAQDAANYAAGFVFNYDGAVREADALRLELNTLVPSVARTTALELENQRLRENLRFVRANPRLQLVPAKVLQRTQGMLTIDLGSLQGVQPGVAAITKDGVVGIVTEVEPTMSYVASLHNADCRIQALTARGRIWGVVQGTGSDISRICAMRYISIQDEIRPGDLVVSFGGTKFPSDMPIGTVDRVYEDGSLSKAAVIKPSADPYAIEELLLVYHARPTVEEMSALHPGESGAQRATRVPDDRPLQERYAP